MSAWALLNVGRSVVVGAVLAATRTVAERARPLDFSAFLPALEHLPAGRLERVDALVATATIAEVSALLEAGELTATELTLSFLARVRRLDGELRSIIELNPEALDEAARADQRRADGLVLGPLDGVPVTLKDNIETAGPMHTTAGAQILDGHVAAADAPIVAALRAAGVVILGKANLSELAGAVCSVPGVSAVGGATVNPVGARFSPGGSSSGSAVSVAAGLCLASVGTETSGSLIAPSAFNGVVGMKPSRGLLGGDGIVPLVRYQDSAGPVARCVADAALLLHAMSGGQVALETSPGAGQGVAVGVLRGDILGQRSPLEATTDNLAVLDRIVTRLEGAGFRAVDCDVALPDLRAALEGKFTITVLGGLAHDTMGYLAAAGAAATTIEELQAYNLRDPRRRMPKGQFLLSLAVVLAPGAADYEKAALAHRDLAEQVLAATFEAAGVEVLVSLTNLHSTLYATAGYPAVTVPVGLRASGMPVGVTLIGKPGTDAKLLAFAHAFEQTSHAS